MTTTTARADGTLLAYVHLPGATPTVVFLPGFASDMQGSKALAVAAECARMAHACLRLDYSGHGASGGVFTDGTIGQWTDDAALMIDRVTTGPIVLVGSSMGGWIALLLARRLGTRVIAVIGIAAAPDFTERLMWDAMMPDERTRLMQDGAVDAPSDYGAPLRITRALIEDGRRHLLLGGPIALGCPVRLLHGQADPDVPWETALAVARQLTGGDVQITLIKDGDHRLSRPADIALLLGLLRPFLVRPFLVQDGSEALAVGGIVPA